MILLTGCAASRGKAFLVDGFDTTYKPEIKQIAILPFDNRTSRNGVERTVRHIVYERLMKISGKNGQPVILPKNQVDLTLYNEGILEHKDLINLPLQKIGEKLGVDAVLMGVVRTYVAPTEEQLVSNFVVVNMHQARSSVQTQFQLYSCRDGQLVWEKVSTGNFIPLIAVTALFSSPELAMKPMAKDLVASWPFKNRKGAK